MIAADERFFYSCGALMLGCYRGASARRWVAYAMAEPHCFLLRGEAPLVVDDFGNLVPVSA